jgi:hypothetical protein
MAANPVVVCGGGLASLILARAALTSASFTSAIILVAARRR